MYIYIKLCHDELIFSQDNITGILGRNIFVQPSRSLLYLLFIALFGTFFAKRISKEAIN